MENPEIKLGDEAEKIFLCTEGDADDISEEMQSFLKYVAEGIPSDSFTSELDNAVKGAREQAEWRREYMNLQEMLEQERKEGLEEGIEKGRAEERVNTEREKARADAEKARADAMGEEIRRLKEMLAALNKGVS